METKQSTVATKPVVDKSSWEYVEIPEKDLLGQVHCDVTLNRDVFEAGQKYFVSPEVAGEVKRMLRAKEIEDIRLYRPDAHQKSLKEASRGGHGNGGVTTNQFA